MLTQICHIFEIMVMVVNAAFASNLLPYTKAEITFLSHALFFFSKHLQR